MEAVLFCGIQGTGKSTFYVRRFFRTHVRVNLDMLRTRHRELILFNACLAAKQPGRCKRTGSRRYRSTGWSTPGSGGSPHGWTTFEEANSHRSLCAAGAAAVGSTLGDAGSTDVVASTGVGRCRRFRSRALPPWAEPGP